MTQISLDTSVLIGLIDSKDVWHKSATELEQVLKAYQLNVIVSGCVLAEAISVMARRIHEQRRITDLNRLVARILSDYPTDDILWIMPDVPMLYPEIIELVQSSGGELNFNDALIALSCRNRNIPFIASFDRDFDQLSWLQRIGQPRDFKDLT